MDTPDGFVNCERVQSYYTFYRVPVAALLWCESPIKQVDEYLSKASEIKPGIFSLPDIPCLELKCRVIHEAINSGELPVCRENGVVVEDHVAAARRHVRREDLKAWIAKNFPDDKPEFLFDKVERSTHSSINTEAFQALQVEREALRAELKKEKELNLNLSKKCEGLKTERDELESKITEIELKSSDINPRSETTYLNIIGAMKELMLSSSPTGKKLSVYDNQAAIVDALLSYYDDGKQGIKKRTLDGIFSAANKIFNSY